MAEFTNGESIEIVPVDPDSLQYIQVDPNMLENVEYEDLNDPAVNAGSFTFVKGALSRYLSNNYSMLPSDLSKIPGFGPTYVSIAHAILKCAMDPDARLSK